METNILKNVLKLIQYRGAYPEHMIMHPQDFKHLVMKFKKITEAEAQKIVDSLDEAE